MHQSLPTAYAIISAMSAEILWVDQQAERIEDTIITLRKIRTAATTGYTPLQKASRNVESLFRSVEPIPENREVVLFDAEKLVMSAGDYIAAGLSHTSSGEIELEEWQDTLSDLKKRYKRYDTATFADSTLKNVVIDSVVGRFKNLAVDPDFMLHWELVNNNNLGIEEVDELLEKRIGIISPLSGDYFMAYSYSSYLDRLKGKSFPVKPAVLSKDLKMVVLPKDEKGQLVYQLVPEIALYIDTTDTGDTGRALYQAVKEAYPGKTVHQPRSERADFIPSQKIVDFRKRNNI